MSFLSCRKTGTISQPRDAIAVAGVQRFFTVNIVKCARLVVVVHLPHECVLRNGWTLVIAILWFGTDDCNKSGGELNRFDVPICCESPVLLIDTLQSIILQ